MRTSLFLLLFAIFLGCFATPAKALYEFLGAVETIERTSVGLVLKCEDRHSLRLTVISPAVVRVQLFRSGVLADPLEYPLALDAGNRSSFLISETDSIIELQTEELLVQIHREPCRIDFLTRKGVLLSADDPGMGIGWDGNEVRCWKQIDDGDKFYGLGSKVGSLNRRGRQFELWNNDYPAFDNRTDPLYQSIPFFTKLRNGVACGYYFNNSYHSTFNFGAGNLRYYSFAAAGGDLDYFFIAGPDIDDVMQNYAKITGTMVLPPKWALGYQQCRWSYYPEAEVRTLAKTFRDKQIPCDVIYLDIHYMDEYKVFSWHPERFPRPRKMLDDLEHDGFKVVTIIDPGVKVDPAYEVATSGLERDCYVRYPDGSLFIGEVWPGRCYFPDYSKPDCRDWWGDWIGKWLGFGVDGSWIDMNEPAVWGNAFPLETLFDDDGRISSHKKMHNLYGLLMARATYEGAREAQPDKRPFIMTRAGFAGVQRYSSVWTGDNVANEEHIALGIRQTLGLSISGIPFCGTDVGGFIETPSSNLYTRWMQIGSLTPLFRTHSHYDTPDQEPWTFGESTEAICRDYLNYRYSLLPYLYSVFYDSHKTGSPVMRPLFYHDQADEQTHHWFYEHQFFIGEKLLAAPVIEENQWMKKVYLPVGSWLNVNTEEVFAGPGEFVIDAPYDKMPVFYRDGAIIPSRDPQQYTSESDLTRLYVDVFAPEGSEGMFVFYEDDGASYENEAGAYRETKWSSNQQDGELYFEQSRPHDQFETPRRALELRFHDVLNEPQTVTMNEMPLNSDPQSRSGWFVYDQESRLLKIHLPSDPKEFILSVR